MSLYKQWTDTVVDYVKTKGEAAFWEEYGSMEKRIYSSLLLSHKNPIKGKLSDMAEEYGVFDVFFMGFLDSLNSSLKEPLNLKEIEADSELELYIDYEKLYITMLEAGTNFLYELPQWEAALSSEKIRHLKAKYKGVISKKSKNKIGRNDACPCGSGKKYKHCCGKND